MLKALYGETEVKPISLELAHRRLGHISPQAIWKLANGRATGLKLKGKEKGLRHPCDACKMGQSKAKPHPKKQRTLKRSTRPFELIHVDLLVGTTRSLGESIKYLLIIVDDYSRYTWGIGLKKKDEAVVQFRRWRRAMRARYGEK